MSFKTFISIVAALCTTVGILYAIFLFTNDYYLVALMAIPSMITGVCFGELTLNVLD